MLIRDHVVETISASSVQRILASEKLKPWRVHHWLSSKVPRDERFREIVHNICDLYTRKLGLHERVLSLDEKTSLQPRTRTSRNRPAQPSNKPVVVEHEYVRKGALNLFAAFDTRTGRVVGILRRRKRQIAKASRPGRATTCAMSPDCSRWPAARPWCSPPLRGASS